MKTLLKNAHVILSYSEATPNKTTVNITPHTLKITSKPYYRGLIYMIFLFSLNTAFAQDVLMQAWYWDYPKTTEGANWSDSLWFETETLSSAGFTYLWLPPLTRCSSGNSSNGYDPKDLYDYGEYGGGATGFGTRADLDKLVGKLNDNGIDIIADLVYNHRDGGAMENNPGLKSYWAGYNWTTANNGANPFPYDRMRVILPMGGSTGYGAGNYYFKLRSSSTHSKFHNWEYKFYAQTNAVGWQGLPDITESEPNGGGDCGETNNSIQLGVDVNAWVDNAGCVVDEFHISIGSSDFNASGDTIYIYFGNRNSGYSDMEIYGIWYDGTGSDIVGSIEYQTYTDFSQLPSGQGTMNWSNFKPNLDNATYLEGDWDGMYFFYDYDQFQDDTKEKLVDWTIWNWDSVGVRGLRMDAVKHFTPEFVGDMLDSLHDNSMDPGIVVGEVFDSNPATLAGWVNNVFTYMDTDTKNSINPRVFDFALRNNLRQACDETGVFDVRNVFSGSVVDAAGLSGYNAVTFVNNHDFRDNSGYSALVHNDAILAYAYILTNNHLGVPMIFYPDYFGYPDNDTKYPYFPADKSALSADIDKLMLINRDYISGSTSRDYLNRFSTPYSSNYISSSPWECLIYQMSGGVSGKEIIVAINFSSGNLQVDHEIAMNNGLTVGSQLVDIVGNSAHPYAQVNGSNQIYIDLPPRSWSVWVQGNPVSPLPPGELSVVDASSDRISVSWTDNSVNEDGFVIESEVAYAWMPIDTVPSGTEMYSDSTPAGSGTDYLYRVYAYNSSGNSAYSNEVITKPYILWKGYSTDWSNIFNWSPQIIPDSNCSVVIPSMPEGGSFPEVNTGSYGKIKSLDLENNSSFTIPVGSTIEIEK